MTERARQPGDSGHALRGQLVALLGDASRVSDGESARHVHGHPPVGAHAAVLPDVVVFPEDRDEVARVLAFAHRERIAVVPYGAGTSAEGETIPLRGGISLDMARLDAVEVRPEALQATVGAGVRRMTLDAHARRHGLFFPVDPGADATLGGMAATNASGTTAVRYGAMRHNVLEAEVVLADGRVIRTGSRALKTSAGYNLLHLFIGSEGTLGVITGLTVRLYGIPEHVVAARVGFAELEGAAECARALVAAGVRISRVELLDGGTIAAINAYKGEAIPEIPHLFLELGGGRVSVEGDLVAARELALSAGCTSFETATDDAERARLWEARHHVKFAMEHAHPGMTLYGTDTCVPISELPGAIREARRTMEGAGLPTSMVGHVGDGNYHAMFMVDPSDQATVERVKRVTDAIVDDALARGGTCSGEIGIGLGKMDHLEREHPDLLPLMRDVKRVLDPAGILNPGKIFRA